MRNFKEGDRVEVIDDNITGIVINIMDDFIEKLKNFSQIFRKD